MSGRARQSARLVRVRSIQHGLAALIAEHAARKVESLESSAGQLARLREGFGSELGLSSGAALAGIGEIAMRLDAAREGLGKSIASARARAAESHQARMTARRKQESAQRITDKKAAAAAREVEKKQVAARLRRPGLREDERS